MESAEIEDFPGHHANQACHKSGISSPECHEIKGADGELLSRVKLEQADTHAGIKPAYWIISNCGKDV